MARAERSAATKSGGRTALYLANSSPIPARPRRVYTDTASLTIGRTYGYAVQAINASGIGEWSETSSAVINPALPSAPRRLTVVEETSGIVLDWLAPADNGLGGAITGYNIWRHNGSSWSELIANTGSTARTYTDTDGPAEGQIYQYTVTGDQLRRSVASGLRHPVGLNWRLK